MRQEEERRLRIEAEVVDNIRFLQEEEERHHIDAEVVEAARLKPHEEEDRLRIENEEVEAARLEHEDETRLRIEFKTSAVSAGVAARTRFLLHKEEECLHIETNRG